MEAFLLNLKYLIKFTIALQKLVIMTKSIEYMPLSISLASFGNGVAWTTYSLLPFDKFITVNKLNPFAFFPFSSTYWWNRRKANEWPLLLFFVNSQIPNGIGTLFSVAQLILYATYYKSTKMQIAARKANKIEVDLSQVVVANGNQRSK